MEDMVMKRNYIYIALLCASLFTLTGCVEENLEPIKPAQVGDEIIFGVRAGFEDSAPETKTEYGGKESEYVHGGKTYERINWVAGDMVEIYSPEAANNLQSFHYTVTKSGTDERPEPGANEENPTVTEHLKDYAYLTRYGDAGIQWGSAETHHFYAMYPSSVMWTANADPAVTIASGVFMDYDKNGSPIVNGIIPITQNPTKPIYESSSGHWVVPADMKYAYMVAKGEATKEEASVALTFVPIVTALEVELELDPAGEDQAVDDVKIGYVQVVGSGIAGAFTADLSEWPANGYPKCSNSEGGTDVITIDVRNTNQELLTISGGGSLTFTVFLRPGADIKDLNVSFFDGTRFIGKNLKDANIPMNLKTRIVDLRLPKKVTNLPIYSDKWMDRISGTVEMKTLSLPGTGNSFSYEYNSTNRKYYATQSRDMTIDKQWNLGIRAFEIVSNRGNYSNNRAVNLGNENVECNKTSVGITVRDALKQIIAKVRPTNNKADWTETAVVILTYQPHGQSRSRNAAYYAQSLSQLYDEIAEEYDEIFSLFTPSTKLEDVRGKILLLCRINQMHEGETSGNTGTNTTIARAQTNYNTAKTTIGTRNIVLIDGCGTGKDKWGARGYTVNTAPNSANNTILPVLNMDCKTSEINTENETFSFVEQYMDNENEWRTYVNTPTWTNTLYNENEGNVDFTYSTNQTSFSCWFQEWARVSNGGGDRGSEEYFRHSRASGNYTEANIYWFNSYNEKLANAAYTFNKSINDNSQTLIYINWLGGYLIDQGVSGGITRYYSDANRYGGDGGDVQGLAAKLNPDFMRIVENSGWENKTGPAGIVMIDYVGATEGAELLPGTILMNNFRHDAAAGGGVIVTPPGSGEDVDNEIEE